ncbi:MAG: nickel-responsive transcriptional regulator NikR [bacterium]
MTRTKLIRFGVSIPEDLLKAFDRIVKRKRYTNRSEALRDIIRDQMVHAAAEEDRNIVGTLTMIYDHHVPEVTRKMLELQHKLGAGVLSTLHIHLDHDHCLEVVVLRGRVGLIQPVADQLLSLRGVKHGRFVITAPVD